MIDRDLSNGLVGSGDDESGDSGRGILLGDSERDGDETVAREMFDLLPVGVGVHCRGEFGGVLNSSTLAMIWSVENRFVCVGFASRCSTYYTSRNCAKQVTALSQCCPYQSKANRPNAGQVLQKGSTRPSSRTQHRRYEWPSQAQYGSVTMFQLVGDWVRRRCLYSL